MPLIPLHLVGQNDKPRQGWGFQIHGASGGQVAGAIEGLSVQTFALFAGRKEGFVEDCLVGVVWGWVSRLFRAYSEGFAGWRRELHASFVAWQ